MGEPLTKENTMQLDFSPANSELEEVDISNTEVFDAFVFDQLRVKGKKYGIGGYLEHRAIYRRSEVFATTSAEFRDIHLGMDIWCSAGSPIFSPWRAVVHSFQDNAGFGNYGPTVILEHELAGEKLYSLYGHLSRKDLEVLRQGQILEAGERVGHVGPFPENGDWPPHLHFQLMIELWGNRGDFPGVASRNDLPKFGKNCPNPALILKPSMG